MIDFGLCMFRSQAKDGTEFTEWQADQDEEGATGRVMQTKLQGGYKYQLGIGAAACIDPEDTPVLGPMFFGILESQLCLP